MCVRGGGGRGGEGACVEGACVRVRVRVVSMRVCMCMCVRACMYNCCVFVIKHESVALKHGFAAVTWLMKQTTLGAACEHCALRLFPQRRIASTGKTKTGSSENFHSPLLSLPPTRLSAATSEQCFLADLR